jgi:hypothetical protein
VWAVYPNAISQVLHLLSFISTYASRRRAGR